MSLIAGLIETTSLRFQMRVITHNLVGFWRPCQGQVLAKGHADRGNAFEIGHSENDVHI